MKITRMPNSANQQPQTIVINERGEGCFLQTLNIGCAIILIIIVAIVAFVALALCHTKPKTQAINATHVPSPVVTPVAQPKNEQAKVSTAPTTAPVAPSAAPEATQKPSPQKSPLDRWDIVKRADEMTDVTTYLFALDGECVLINEFVSYVPKLVIQITPESVLCGVPKYSQDVVIVIETDAFHRGTQDVMIRVDSLEPVTGSLRTSSNRSAVFLPQSALETLDGSERLAMRFTTTLGAVRTLKFNLDGFRLDDLESEIVKRVHADRPKGVEINP